MTSDYSSYYFTVLCFDKPKGFGGFLFVLKAKNCFLIPWDTKKKKKSVEYLKEWRFGSECECFGPLI